MDMLRILPLAVWCCVFSAPTLSAPGQDYAVDFTAGSNGSFETVVGNIDLSRGKPGAITPSEIVSWSLSSVPGDPVTFSGSSASGDTVNCIAAAGCSLVAGHGRLTLTTSLAGFTNIQFSSNDGPINLIGPFQAGPFCLGPDLCIIGNSGGGDFAMVPGQVLATRVRGHSGKASALNVNLQANALHAVVPEPGTFSILALALVGLATARMRCKRASL
jgi:PEP-CTERM motif-containing protein